MPFPPPTTALPLLPTHPHQSFFYPPLSVSPWVPYICDSVGYDQFQFVADIASSQDLVSGCGLQLPIMTPGPYPTNDPFGGKPQKELFDIEQSSKVEGRDRARLQYEQHVSKKRGGAGLSGSKWETPSPSTTPIESSKRHAGASSSTRASSAASLDTLPAGKQPKLGAVRQASAPVSSPTRDDHPKKQVNQQLFQQPNLSDNPANVAGPNVVRPISPSKNPRPPIKASSPSSAQPAKPSGAFEELRPYLNHEWGSSSGSSSKSPLLPRMQNNSPSSTLSQAERPVPTSPDFISKPFEQLSIATSQNGQSSLRQASQMSGASPDNSQKSGTDDISSYDESSDSSDYSADGPVTPPTRKMLVPKTRYKNGLSSPLQALSKGNVAPLSMENHKPSQASKDQNPVYGSKPLSHDSKTVKPLASMNINAPKSSMAESKYAPKGPEAGESTAGPRMPSFESYQDKLVELDIAKNKPAVVPSQSGPKAMLSTSMAESKFSVVTTPASRAAVPTQQMSSKDSNTSKAPRDSPFGLAGDVGKKLAKYDWKQNDAKENHTSTTAPMSPKASVLQTMPNSRSLSISDAPPSPFGNISGTQDKLAKYDWKQTPVKEEKKSATVPPAPKAAQIQSSSGVRLTSSTTSDRPNKDNSEPQSFSQSKSKHEATSQDGQASKGLASTVIPARMGADTRTASKGPAAALGVPRVLPRQAATASTRSVSTPLARAPASLLTAKASKANMKANIAAACSTLSSIANEGLSDEEGEVVGGWGQGDAPVRRGPSKIPILPLMPEVIC